MDEFFSRKTQYWLRVGGLLCLSAIFVFLMAEKINLLTADLGRHLANGEILLSGENQKAVLTTDFYSYTHPDFPFINHHWGSGVVFFLVWKLTGFVGVHLFFLFLSLLTFGVFFFLASRKGGYLWAFVFSLLLIPLLAERKEVRPEMFSCLFGGLFFLILWGCEKRKFSEKFLWALPFLQLIWVNLHVAFFLGSLILGVFLFQAVVRKDFLFFKKLIKVSVISSAVLFLNPNGWRGAIYPLRIFDNFGYDLAENKSIHFLENFGMQNPNFFLLKVTLFLAAGSFIWIVWKKRSLFSWADFCLATIFSIMALLALRNMSLAAFFLWPILAGNFKKIFSFKLKIEPEVFLAGLLGYVGLTLVVFLPLFSDAKARRGVGLMENCNQSAEFFQKNKITGPIFNNYDIGGYLIFHLRKREKVFVDNRPEAYPAEFFKETYIPAQENQQSWQELETQYGFNSVFFYRHDLTPWGQNFLISLVKDSDWAPVFVDDYAIIFLKKNEKNQAIIEKFELPKEMFGTKN